MEANWGVLRNPRLHWGLVHGRNREKESIESWDDEYSNDKLWETCVSQPGCLKESVQSSCRSPVAGRRSPMHESRQFLQRSAAHSNQGQAAFLRPGSLSRINPSTHLSPCRLAVRISTAQGPTLIRYSLARSSVPGRWNHSIKSGTPDSATRR